MNQAEALAVLNPISEAIRTLGAISTEPPPPPVPSFPVDASYDWAADSKDALVAYRLRSAGIEDANLAARHRSPGNTLPICYWVPNEATYQKPVIDEFGMRFDVTEKGSADCVVQIPPFGVNSQVRIKWTALFNDTFINTTFRGPINPATGKPDVYPGIKMMIVCSADYSSDSEKFVMSTRDQHKFPSGYRYSWATGATENFEIGINGGTDFDYQPRIGQAPTCLRSVWMKTAAGLAVPGCDTLVANKIIYFELEMDTDGVIAGTNGNAWDCEYRAYMTPAGGIRKLLFSYGKGTPGYQGRRAKPWTGLWMVPFMTGRDLTQQFDGVPSVWYRDLIVKGKPTAVISVPTDPPPVVMPPPVPPTTQTGLLPVFTPIRDATGKVTNYSTLPLNAWYQIENTKMTSLLGMLPQSNSNDMNNIMANWGSSANDPATGDMHLHGGAHGANGENNGWYSFNCDRADWRITVAPLYMTAVEKAYLDKAAKLYSSSAIYNGSWNIGMPPDFMFLPVVGSVTGDPTLDNPNAISSGKVYAHHCWHKLVWLEWMNQLFVSLIHMYLLDPKTGKVTILQKHNDTDWQYNTADPVTKRVYGLTRAFSYNDYWDFREYDPATDKIVANYPITLKPSDRYYFSANDARCIVGREIVFYNGIQKTWFAFHMDTKAWRILTWNQLPFVSSAGDWTMVYDPIVGIIASQGWGELYQVNSTTGMAAKFQYDGPQQINGTNTAVNNGLFDRFWIRNGLLFALDWATSNVKVMRLK